MFGFRVRAGELVLWRYGDQYVDSMQGRSVMEVKCSGKDERMLRVMLARKRRRMLLCLQGRSSTKSIARD